MTAKHTPGPWEIEKYRREEYWFPDDHYSVGPAIVGDEADARLIAAAPDLLAAAKYRLHYLDEDTGEHCDCGACLLLWEAIEKAEGRND